MPVCDMQCDAIQRERVSRKCKLTLERLSSRPNEFLATSAIGLFGCLVEYDKTYLAWSSFRYPLNKYCHHQEQSGTSMRNCNDYTRENSSYHLLFEQWYMCHEVGQYLFSVKSIYGTKFDRVIRFVSSSHAFCPVLQKRNSLGCMHS